MINRWGGDIRIGKVYATQGKELGVHNETCLDNLSFSLDPHANSAASTSCRFGSGARRQSMPAWRSSTSAIRNQTVFYLRCDRDEGFLYIQILFRRRLEEWNIVLFRKIFSFFYRYSLRTIKRKYSKPRLQYRRYGRK
jgi:hypothetical protein